MAVVYFPGSENLEPGIQQAIRNFRDSGTLVGNGNRNTVKSIVIEGKSLNFKLFKRPNLVNKFVYRYLRKSKARRSFENACLLVEKGFFTPQPVAYIEKYDAWGLSDSYYICEQLDNIVELRRAILEEDYPDRQGVIRYFTRYFHRMHEAKIEFLDNSPGNSLVETLPDTDYKIYLVDLNRMKTGQPMTTEQRMKNFSRISEDPEVINIIANEYALVSGIPAAVLQQQLQEAVTAFWSRLRNKKRVKKKFKALKKKIGL